MIESLHFLTQGFYSEIFPELCCGKCCDLFFTIEIIFSPMARKLTYSHQLRPQLLNQKSGFALILSVKRHRFISIISINGLFKFLLPCSADSDGFSSIFTTGVDAGSKFITLVRDPKKSIPHVQLVFTTGRLNANCELHTVFFTWLNLTLIKSLFLYKLSLKPICISYCNR